MFDLEKDSQARAACLVYTTPYASRGGWGDCRGRGSLEGDDDGLRSDIALCL